MKVRLISITPDAEKLIAYCARVSNPSNQDSDRIENLISYCIRKQHWSIFQQAHMTLEIETSRAIAAQILRHWSFGFQEFSARYASIEEFGEEWYEPIELRQQAESNRQSSTVIIRSSLLETAISEHLERSRQLYLDLLSAGVAKECARFVLPLTTKTRLYMTGSIRSWIHYLLLRASPETQKEHQAIAQAAFTIFESELPIIAAAL